MVFLPHATSYNSSGNGDSSNEGGRPSGSLNDGSEGADENKSEQNQNYRDSQNT